MKLTAACAFGLEALVKRELIALGYEPTIEQPGRVSFTGNTDAICRTNLWLRFADRILIEVQQFPCPDFDALFDTIKQFDWSSLIPSDAEFPVIGRSRLSQLTSVPAVQRTVKKALVESLQRDHKTNTLPETGGVYKVEVALLKDVATLTIDTTGPSLHKRGYRKLVGPAPLKETLAAALVDLSVWKPDRPLVDPFCGSGTIAIESALIARNVAPGLHRKFASSDWSLITQLQWDDARQQAESQIDRDGELQIIATDRDPEVLSLARYHAKQAGVEADVHFQQRSFQELRSKREYGCIITNPPYGERLEEQRSLRGLYESIPMVMQRLPTWSLFLITNMPRFESMIQRKATRRRKLFNGRIECTYYQFLGPRPPRKSDRINEPDSQPAVEPVVEVEPLSTVNPNRDDEVATSVVTEGESDQTEPRKTKPPATPLFGQPLFGQLTDKDREQAQLFRSRLIKRAKHLRRWPKRGVTCFRLYERDIPEIPLVVDRYEDYLHLTEYERPHERDLARHAAWLELMVQTAAECLEVPIQKTFLKQRKKDEAGQYQKLDQQQKKIRVQEQGLTFLVNLNDYVDTGLFLDHRNTRAMVRDKASGKDVLNLFAYTGSFSVYAAAGGASSVTTVDLSRNYLGWAKENLLANDLWDDRHRLVAMDSIEFLDSIAARGPQFDLAIVDPPTYSNSKRLDEDWNVQTTYVELLGKLAIVMRTGGEVYFSTNFRRFKFDEAAVPDFETREISNQTVPEDFRNKRIHRCWWMKKR
ncbi:MAG: bifunctional 23S rRNA (guanine(2069)-N(7))-methyltransferase RlmK/23S rRNA (guanine(2445)-N(2))-methyltransferase RlmL [Planctomycetota bacterium]